VIGINANEGESAADVKDHAAKNNLTFPILKDNGSKVADMLGASRTPEAYFLDASNKLLYHGRIDNSRDESQVNSTTCATRSTQLSPASRLRKQPPARSGVRSNVAKQSTRKSARGYVQLKHLFIAVAVVVLAGSLFPNAFATAQTRAAHPRAGSRAAAKAPVPRAVNAEEMQALLKRDGSRPLLVNYWATWCDPCRDEFPDLVKIDNDYRRKGLDFIAVTLDDLADLKTGVPKFLRQMNAKMPVYLLNVPDPEPTINLVDREWGGALPATFLYNSKGELVYKHFGRVKTDELRAAIEKLVSSKQ
jgi:thiol-disulfide isomerase/thioredoxin